MKICIGPGHGGSDPGAVNGSRREASDNLRLAQRVADILRDKGHNLLLTRTGDVTCTPQKRRELAIAFQADLYLDLHRNSFTAPSARGTEIWIRDESCLAAAKMLMSRLVQVEGQKSRGVKTGAYQVLYQMPMPAMLLELGFISNQEDNRQFDECFEQNAIAVSDGILQILGCDSQKTSERLLYRVQVGAYAEKANAQTQAELFKSKGYPAYIVIKEESNYAFNS